MENEYLPSRKEQLRDTLSSTFNRFEFELIQSRLSSLEYKYFMNELHNINDAYKEWIQILKNEIKELESKQEPVRAYIVEKDAKKSENKVIYDSYCSKLINHLLVHQHLTGNPNCTMDEAVSLFVENERKRYEKLYPKYTVNTKWAYNEDTNQYDVDYKLVNK